MSVVEQVCVTGKRMLKRGGVVAVMPLEEGQTFLCDWSLESGEVGTGWLKNSDEERENFLESCASTSSFPSMPISPPSDLSSIRYYYVIFRYIR